MKKAPLVCAECQRSDQDYQPFVSCWHCRYGEDKLTGKMLFCSYSCRELHIFNNHIPVDLV